MIMSRNFWLLFLFLNAISLVARAQSDFPIPTAKVTPLTAKPGDTITMVVTTDKCPDDSSTRGWLKEDSLRISGGDTTVKYLPDASDKCTASYSVTISSKPINRELTVLVFGEKSPDKGNMGRFLFHIVDAPSISPRPIPPGIPPQVDVMWDVMSEAACRDQYGSRLAKYYYCVDVVLGNNSGYPLILAAVGFRQHIANIGYKASAASYLSARATAQQGQVLSARAITLQSLQGAGALIAGFAPFSGNAGRRGRIAIWSTLFGSVLGQVGETAIPNLTLKNVQNLDDAALRDGKLIPNNSPVRFSVFVDRDALVPILERSQAKMRQDLAAIEARVKALTVAISNEKDSVKKASLEAELEMQIGWIKGDKVLAEEQKKSNEKPRKNSMNPIGRKKSPIERNLFAVRLALGDLIIVGDQIEYLQRVQVDTAAVVPTIELDPKVTDSAPDVQQGKADDIVLLGRGLAKVFKVTAIKCAPSEPFEIQPDSAGNSITLKGFKVSGCAESAIPLRIENGTATFLYSLRVTPMPQVDGPYLAELEQKNNTVEARFYLKGSYLAGAVAAITHLPTGTELHPSIPGEVAAGSDNVSLNFTAKIPADAVKNGSAKASVRITTPAGGDSATEFTLAFKPALAPSQEDIPVPATSQNPTTLSFTLKGKGLTGVKGAKVVIHASSQATDLEVDPAKINMEMKSDTEVKFSLTIDASNNVYLVAGSEIAISDLTNGVNKAGKKTLKLK